MKKILVLICVIMGVYGCNNVGGTGNPSISAQVTSGNCSNFTSTNESCTVTITYNTNGATGISLGYTPNPLPTAITSNGTFNSTFGACQTQVNNSVSGQYSCPVTITYTSGIGGANFNLAFTLGNATSNTITVEGN